MEADALAAAEAAAGGTALADGASAAGAAPGADTIGLDDAVETGADSLEDALEIDEIRPEIAEVAAAEAVTQRRPGRRSVKGGHA